jgi:tetratricopeptide (TPR) repeat protein
MSRPQLYLNHDADFDWLIAVEYGAADDDQPDEYRKVVSDSFAYLLDRPGGRAIGFTVKGFSAFDPEDARLSEAWEGPRFDAPQLGLRNASAGEIAVAAGHFFKGDSSVNRWHFDRAVGSSGKEAEFHWRATLQAGDAMAHYGLGYTLVELGRAEEARAHLEEYTRAVPENAWAWCWLGRACEEMGEPERARAAYEKALELEAGSEDETDAAELLEGLDEGGISREMREAAEGDADDDAGDEPAGVELVISYDAGRDFLWALFPGEVVDGHLPDETDEVGEGVYVYLRGPDGPVIGFGVEDLSEREPPLVPDELTEDLRFDVPMLCLLNTGIDEIAMAARDFVGGISTPGIQFFHLAVEAGEKRELEEAEALWRLCLAAGEPQGHFGLGCALCERERYDEAVPHLVTYVQIAPRHAWAWSWLGRACEGMGLTDTARDAYETAVELEEVCGYETDARQRLEGLAQG